MKIYTLGTSHGATEVGRACSGTVISVGDKLYLFDCGGGTEGKMTDCNLPIRDVCATFISHMHEDHAGGLTAIAKRFCVYICDRATDILIPEEQGVLAFKSWFSALHLPNISLLNIRSFTAGEIYADDAVRVTAIPTKHIEHGKFPSFAFLLEAEGKKIIYTGDLSTDFIDYPSVISDEELDCVVCELTHFDVENSLHIIARSKTKRVIFTHIYPGKDELMCKVKDDLNFKFEIASDGECFEI